MYLILILGLVHVKYHLELTGDVLAADGNREIRAEKQYAILFINFHSKNAMSSSGSNPEPAQKFAALFPALWGRSRCVRYVRKARRKQTLHEI